MNPLKEKLFKPFKGVKRFRKLNHYDLMNSCPHKAGMIPEYSLEKSDVPHHDAIKHLAPDAAYSSRVRVVKGYCPVCETVHRVERVSIMVSMQDGNGEWWSETYSI